MRRVWSSLDMAAPISGLAWVSDRVATTLSKNSPPQTGASRFVPADSFTELGGGRRAGPDRSHRPRRSRSIRRLTSSQSSSLAVPASISATRRSISAAHATSASGSSGPARLARSSAAISARASTSSRKASARTVRADLVMSRSYSADSPLNKSRQPTSVQGRTPHPRAAVRLGAQNECSPVGQEHGRLLADGARERRRQQNSPAKFSPLRPAVRS
jgi:hypothetical protein